MNGAPRKYENLNENAALCEIEEIIIAGGK